MPSSVVGLICVCLLAVGSIPEGDAQLFGFFQPRQAQQQYYQPQPSQQQQYYQQQPAQQQQPQQGSVTTADSEAYNRDVKLGNLVGLNGGITRSQSLTQGENGATNAARSTSLSRGAKIGNLDISSTLTGSRAINNGQVSGGLAQNLNIGKLGIDSSLSRDNLKNGIGIHRSEDGGLDLDLGLLSIDLSKNKKQPTAGQTGTNAQVQAVGDGANVNSISDTNSRTQQLGKLSSTSTYSRSNAIGSVLRGFTSGRAGGFAGGAPSYAASGNYRRRRQLDFYFPGAYNPGGFGPNYRQPQRQPQHKPHHGHQQRPGQGHQQPQFQNNANAQGSANSQNNNFQQRPGQFAQPQFANNAQGIANTQQKQRPGQSNNNANAQGIANNQNANFQQQAGANTATQNTVNEQGAFQGNTGSSISSNLANDGSSGQLSAANTAQQNYQTAHETGSKNAAQSQSLNFDKDSTQGTASNADTSHIKTADSERIEANSGAMANQQTQFGTAANAAKAGTVTFNENGRQGTESNANSQSTLQGANGQVGSANTGAKTQSVIGPDGTVNNSASSNAASFSNNGGPVSASASSSSGFGPNGAFNNAAGSANTNGAGSNALSQGGFFGGGRRNPQFFGNGPRRRREISQQTVEPRTFDQIYDLFQTLFPDTSCTQCNVYTPYYPPRNCCPPCCNYRPQPRPLLPPPLPPPPPPPPRMPVPPPPLPPPTFQITSASFTPWYYPRPYIPCCPTCGPQIGAFPCGRGGAGGGGQPYPPPYYNYYG